MEFLRNWIRNLILVILTAHFIELLLPENELRKYVKVVIGFFVIAVILTPVLRITNQELPGLNIDLITGKRPSFSEIVNRGQKLKRNHKTAVKESYCRKLEEQVKAVVNLNSDLKNINVKIESTEESRINRVFITGQKSRGSKQVYCSKESQPNKQIETNLQNLIANLYGVKTEKIQVDVE